MASTDCRTVFATLSGNGAEPVALIASCCPLSLTTYPNHDLAKRAVLASEYTGHAMS